MDIPGIHIPGEHWIAFVAAENIYLIAFYYYSHQNNLNLY